MQPLLNTNNQHTNYYRIERAIKFLETNFHRQPELDEIAGMVNLSPFHFQRIFTEWAGISPKKFLQYLTVGYLKEKLQHSRNLVEAAEAAGLSAQSRVYDLFTTLEAVTPQEYKLHGKGIVIQYGFHHTLFGHCLIGATERGICWLSFIQEDEDPVGELNKMKTHWHNSVFRQNNDLTQNLIHQIFDQKRSGSKLHLLVKGTNFQIKVWDALLKIPMGCLSTYQDVARQIKSPKALQAVGSAVGANHIALLIPCHRVIRKDGLIGEYRWSTPRKKSLVGWEMAVTGPTDQNASHAEVTKS